MKLSDITDVLSFQAFRPDADDSSAPIQKRLQGKRFLCLNLSKDQVSWRQIDRKGEYGPGGVVKGQLKDALAQMGEEWLGQTDGGWVVVSMNNRFFITLENNMSRKPGAEITIRTNPRSVIGTKYDRGKKYAIHHNPETSASLLLSCEESLIKSIEDELVQAGFQVARISCGLFAMVEDYVRREHAARNGSKGKDFTLIACCEGSVCILAQRGGQWTELRSRAALYTEEDIEPILNIAQPVLRGGAGTIVVLHDQANTATAEQLASQLQTESPVNVTQPEHLWMVLTQN